MTLVLATLLIALGFVWGMVIRQAIDTYRSLMDAYNYKLFRFLRNKSGIIVGINQHGKLWLEVKRAGKTLGNYTIVKGRVA